MTDSRPKGTVYLVGAGPGDPELLTLKAARLLGAADAVIYDALVSPRVLDHIRPGADVRFVGKRKGHHFAKQEEINDLLVELAGRHEVVVRLKGGDPYLFGRGAEEQEHLVSRGVAVEVVPGVSSAIAVPAYAGIPLTHRDLAPMTVIATGHRKEQAEDHPVDWQRLGGLESTVAVLMGVKRIAEVADGLVAGGRAPGTGAALVEWGTTSRQRVLVSTLAAIADRAREEGFEPPSVLIVGEVVSLHDKLDWFGRLPLLGRRVLVARERPGADPASDALSRLGAEVLAVPSFGWDSAHAGEGAMSRLELGLDGLCVLGPAAVDHLEETVGLGRLAAALGAGPGLCLEQGATERLRRAGLDARLVSGGPEDLARELRRALAPVEK